MMEYKELYNIAKEAMVHAYAPYSRFKVGAALLTVDGKVYTGVNVENSSFGGTICAERTAFVKAVSEGQRRFSALAVVSQEGKVLPCGICRQFMFEFTTHLTIITGTDEEHLELFDIEALMPEGFRLQP